MEGKAAYTHGRDYIMNSINLDEALRMREAYRREIRRNSMHAAKEFVRACAENDLDLLHDAREMLNETIDGWKYAFRRVAKLNGVSDEIKVNFLDFWIESHVLPLSVGHRPTVAAALRVLLPRNYNGGSLTIYRGTHMLERRHRLYGFSWTTKREIAEAFAQGGPDDPGVILETVAVPEAIFVKREDDGFYDEGEVIVDPYKLGRVRVVGTVITEPKDDVVFQTSTSEQGE